MRRSPHTCTEMDDELPGIIVDTNAGEDDMFARLDAKLPGQVRRGRLDIGDVRIVAPDGTVLIVERKSVGDLISSLGDGRYRDQKARQLAAVADDSSGKTTVIWVVQGSVQGWFSLLPPRDFPVAQLECAIISTCVRDGIPVLRAKDAEATAETVAYLHTRALAGELSGAARAQKVAAQGYAGVFHAKKSTNADEKATWRNMLATVHGMSASRAAALCEGFATPRALMSFLEKTPAKEAIKRMASLKAGARALGPKLSDKVYKVLMQE